jgi:glycosyltransferase involved in cell wall biosynthesis
LCSELKKQKTSSLVCFGKKATKLGLAIAPILNLPLYVEIISMREALKVKKDAPVTRWFAATPSFEHAIVRRAGEDRAAFVPLGVTSVPEQNVNSNSSTTCVVVLNASDELKSTAKVLEALKRHPDIHIFLELDGKKDHKVWSIVEEENLLDRTTCLQNVASLRTLIVQTDLVVLPSSQMPIRTILLEAMESNIPILATTIDGFDMLVNGETALIVEDSWDEPLRTILGDENLRARLGSAASALVATNYGSAAQIAALQTAVTPF